MKRFLLVTPILLFTIFFFAIPGQAAEGITPSSDPGVLCLPGVYLQSPGDCTPVGPSDYLTRLAEVGFNFPPSPLPATQPDPALAYIDVRYGLVNKINAPVYGSLEDAMKVNKKNRVKRIDAGFSYISYIDEVVVDGRRFYMINYGAWMTANDIIRIGAVPSFQGVTLSHTPDVPFGWILSYLSSGPVETKRTPGYQTEDYTGHILNNHEIVQIYAEQQIGEDEWYMVGPDEWVHQKVVARVIPNTTPPEGVPGDRWIEINLHEQTVSVYDNGELVFATLIASGFEPLWTRPGLFQIFDKYEKTPMSGSFAADGSDSYYLEDVPWTMYFDEARALHGAYWRANLGFPQSHGCVNLTVGDSRWIFDWAEIGDWVYVWDPSGKTPVDPSLYTAGGA